MRYAADLPVPLQPPSSTRARQAATLEPPFSQRHWLLLLLATAVGAALRMCELGTWSLWIDEAHTWRDATMPLGGENGFWHSDRGWYPLTFLLLRGLRALQWIGGDEYSLRLPFALVGIATVPLVALCGRRLVGRRAALLAAAFCALCPWHVYWSQNARGYVLVAGLAVVAANRAHAWVTGRRIGDLMWMLVAMGTGIMCHPTSAMMLIAFAVFVLLHRLPTWRGKVFLRIVLATLAVGLLLPVITRLLPFQGFLRSKDEPSLLHLVQTIAYYFRPVVLLAGSIGLVFAWRALGRQRTVLLGCFAAVPLLVLFVIGGAVAKTTARYAICTLPVWMWLAAFACIRIGEAAASMRTRRLIRPVFAAVLLPMLLLVEYSLLTVSYFTQQHGQRAQWREVCAFAQEHAGKRGLRLLTVNHPTAIYYLRPLQWAEPKENPYPTTIIWAMVDWLVQAEPATLHEPGAANHLRWHMDQARQANSDFIVIVTLPELQEMDAGGAMWQALQQDFEIGLYLPCWVGPKDESIYVFVTKSA